MVADGIVYELLRLPSGAMRDVGQSFEVSQKIVVVGPQSL
jgi:hypothetical protein